MPVNEKGEYEIGPEIDIRVNEDQINLLRQGLSKVIREHHDQYCNEDGSPRKPDMSKEEHNLMTAKSWDFIDLLGKLVMVRDEDEPRAISPDKQVSNR